MVSRKPLLSRFSAVKRIIEAGGSSGSRMGEEHRKDDEEDLRQRENESQTGGRSGNMQRTGKSSGQA